MGTLVSTGQITIVDNNDAKPLTAFITSNLGMQQTYTKDESTISYIPNWQADTTGLVLTAKVYVGGPSGAAVDVTGLLTNRKWSFDLSNAIPATNTVEVSTNSTMSAVFTSDTGHKYSVVNNTAGSSMTIKANLLSTVPQKVIYFEGDYTDPVTNLTSHIIAQISLSIVKTGTNAVFIQVTGQNVIEQSTNATKNTAILKADLMRANNVDDTGVSYRWTDVLSNSIIYTGMTNYSASKYGFRTTAQANAGTGAGIGQNVPTDTNFNDTKAIIVGEAAVNNFALYKVEAKDADGTTYQTTFTVYDVSDSYTVQLVSTNGDKLQNGVGSTNIYPRVFYGSTEVTDLTGWSFKWKFFDGSTASFNNYGNQAGFIDVNRTAATAGRNINTNSATSGGVFSITYDSTAITLIAGDMVKLVKPSGKVYYYEVYNSSGNVVSLRTPATTSTFLNAVTDWTASVANGDFVGGKLFVCKGTGTTAGTQFTSGGNTATAAQISVTGYEIDSKGTIICEATRP